MTALFDGPWQERLLEGDTEAALQLARSVLQPLYEYCHRQLADQQATQRVVRHTLVRAIHEIRNYDPEVHGNRIWDWIVALAALQLEEVAAPHSTPRNASRETEVGLPGGTSPAARFIYQVETELCLEARRNRDASDEQVRLAKHPVHWKDVAITCPGCGHAYHISVTRLGHRVRCGRCDKTFDATSDVAQEELREVVGDRCWYVKHDGEASGPLTAAELRAKISAGEIAPTQLVRKGEQGAWKPATSAEGLFLPSVSPEPDGSDLPVSVVAPPLPHELPPEKKRSARKVPKRIARFEIREHLGSGSFGDVFRAFDPVLDREVAIKLATSAALDDDRARPLVLQEPKAAAKLRHPNIVAVHDAGFDGHHFYVAIDLIDGCTLRQKLQRGPLDHGAAVQLVMSLAEALDYAHRSKVLHRDVKPSNIMIDAHGQALLMDFGLARIEHSTGEQTHAEPGLLGTPGYMPPEQISRNYGEIGPCSDQYSLGAVFYELLCGQPPFVGPESVLVMNTLHTEPPRPHSKDDTIDLDLEAICLKTLAKKPSDRYASCQEFAEDLRRYQEGRPTKAHPLRLYEQLVRWSRRERALSSALGACISLLLLFVVTLAVTAVVKTRLSRQLADTVEEKTELVVQVEKSLDEAETARVKAETAHQQAEAARQQAVKNLAVTNFRHGHTLCDNDQIPEGLVYLVESLGQAERAQEGDADAKSLAAMIRLSLATWRRQLHELRAMLPHRLEGQDQRVHCVAVEPSGRFAVTASRSENGGAVWFWDLAGKTPARLQDPVRTDEAIEAIAMAHFGKTFATVGRIADLGCVIRMWRYNETDAKWQAGEAWPTDARAEYQAIALSPDGARLVVAGNDGTAGIVREWEVSMREPVHTYYQGPVIPQCVAYSPDGKHLAIGMGISATGEATVVVHKLAGKEMWQNKVDGVVYDLTFSHDGERLAAAVGAPLKGEARMWSVATGNPIGNRLTHLSQVYAVEFSPDDKFILTGSQDRSARLWDAGSGRLLGHPLWHGHDVRDVAFVPSATADAGTPLGLISVSDNVARLWNVALGTPALADRIGPTVLAGARIPGREHQHIAVVGALNLVAGKTRLLDSSVFPLKEVLVLQHEQPATCVAAGTDWGIVGLADGSAVRVNWNTHELEPLAQDHSASVSCAATSQDGRYGATASDDGQTLLWKMSTGELVARIKCGNKGNVNALAFDPLNQNVVLIAGADGQVRFWNGETGEPIGPPLPHLAAVSCAAYADDGLTLAVGLVSGGQIWHRESVDDDWQRGKPLETEIGVLRIQVWPRRQLVATGDFQGSVRFWHVATGEPIGPPLANQGRVTVLIGSGEDVLSGTSSGSIRRWPLPVTMSESQDHLKLWVETITGERLNQEQVIERLEVDQWQTISRQWNLIGATEIDRTISDERKLHAYPVPQLDRVDGESPEQRSVLQDMLQAFLGETPTFRPPPVEYLDRYLPADTEGLIGLDVRQVIAAPLVWLLGMSRRELLFLPKEWKEWLDFTGFHPLLDVHYVLLAACRHSLSSRSWHSWTNGTLPALTMVVKGDFDVERLGAMVQRLAEREPQVVKLLEGPLGKPILEFRTIRRSAKSSQLLVYATLIEEEEGGTLVASLSRDTVERALVSATTNRLDQDFRACVENTDPHHSLWFVARKEIVASEARELWQGHSVLPERIEGSLNVFVDFDFTVRAAYLDNQAAQDARPYVMWLAALLGSTIDNVAPINVQAEVNGEQVVVCGDSRHVTATEQRGPATEVQSPFPASPSVAVVLSLLEYYAFGWRNNNAGDATDETAAARDGNRARAAARDLNRAEMNLQLGDTEGAINLLKAIVTRYPGTEAAEKARVRLEELKGLERSERR